MPHTLLYTTLSLACLCALALVLHIAHKRKHTIIHASVYLLVIALMFQAVSLMLETVHLSIFAHNGKGSYVMDTAADVFLSLSQFSVSYTLIDMVWGWLWLRLPSHIRLPAIVGFGLGLACLHIHVSIFSRHTRSLAFQFHDHDNWGGIVLSVLRVCLTLVFLLGCKRLYAREQKGLGVSPTMGMRLGLGTRGNENFVLIFSGLGSLWLLAFPIVVAVTTLVPAYFQHTVVTIGTLVSQACGLTLLCIFLLSNTGCHKLVTSADVVLPKSNFYD